MKRTQLFLLIGFLLITIPAFSIATAAHNPDTPLSLTYLSPSPGAQHIRPTTSLAFRQGSPFNAQQPAPGLFSIIGSQSGPHSGSVRLSDDRLTVLFYPDKPFAYNETVSVVVKLGLATANGIPVAGTSYQFSTLERPISLSEMAVPPASSGNYLAPAAGPASAQITSHYYTYPEFSNIMTTTVTTPANNAGDGYLFVATMGILTTADPALLILDNNGQPVYIQRTPAGMLVTDFDRQVVNGTPYLTYYVGIPASGWAYGTYYVMNQSYAIVDNWTIDNGYGADLHELRLLNNGHALLLGYTPIPADLTPYGGPADGIIMDILIQEQDSHKNVVFEWHGSEHVALSDSYIDLNASPVDFLHTNAIELDGDGNLLISSRHLSEITKIDRQTGAIMWRLGGKNNQFTFTNDGGFSYQHDIRRLANGDITLFDNGDQLNPPHSRAVEYTLDETAKTVTRVWEYPADTSLFSAFMGSAQRLSNGNTFIGWGALPQVTEVHPDGSKAFELAMGGVSYRAFRYPWDAVPAELPHAAAIYSSNPTTATIFSSWNGATQISAYQVYAGATANSMSLVTTTARTGFETATTLIGLNPATCVFKIRPIKQGVATPFSNTVYRLDRPACRALLNFWYFPFLMSGN